MKALGLALALLLGLAAPAAASPADELLERGLRSYAVGRYPEAIASFQRGYQLDPRPELLYALAQAQRLAGDCRGAVASYRAFLRTTPPERAAAPARQNLARCEEELAAAPPPEPQAAPVAPPVTPPPAPVVPPPRPRWAHDRVGWALGATGLAALGAGAVLWGVGEAGARTLADAPSYPQFAAAAAGADADQRERIAGIVCVAVGGALVVTAVGRFAAVARHR